MKYCTKCGNELIDEAVVCTKCGCCTQGISPTKESPLQPQKDEAEMGLIVLSALIPLIGLVLWAIKNNDSPIAAKKYGLTALIAVGVETVLGLFAVLSFAGMVGGFMGSV